MATRVGNEDRIIINSYDFTTEELEYMIPQELYKYYTINDNLHKTIKENALWFSSPLDFNDPFDCRIRADFGTTKSEITENLKRILSKFAAKNETNKITFEKLVEEFCKNPKLFNDFFNALNHKYFEDNIGVCCFSENSDHPLMWAHYANSHKGICLEFNTQKRGLIHDNILPVLYHDEYPKIRFSDFSKDREITFFYQSLVAKGDDWDYEYEWRAVKTEGNRKAYKFEKSDLIGVIFGVNTSKEDRKKVIQCFKDNMYNHIIFYKAKLHPTKFKIIKRRIKV